MLKYSQLVLQPKLSFNIKVFQDGTLFLLVIFILVNTMYHSNKIASAVGFPSIKKQTANIFQPPNGGCFFMGKKKGKSI